MKYVLVIIAICSLPAGLGVIIDRFLLNRHKGRLHNALLRYWNHLDELNLPDIWRVFAAYAIRFFQRVFGKRIRSFRCIITIILVSFCLTICALLLGLFLQDKVLYDFYNYPNSMAIMLFINLIFDVATGLITTKVLIVINYSTPGKAIVLIVVDIFLALFLAVGCIIVLFVTSPYVSLIELLKTAPEIAFDIIRFFVTWSVEESETVYILYASTTFIPTLIYMSLLTALIISKAVLGIGIRFTKYFLEKATEVKEDKDLAVCTLTGSFFSVIVLFLTAFTMLHKTLH